MQLCIQAVHVPLPMLETGDVVSPTYHLHVQCIVKVEAGNYLSTNNIMQL